MENKKVVEVLRKYLADERRGCLPETRQAIEEALLALEKREDGRRIGLLEAYRDVLLNGFERNIDTFEFIRKRIEEFERGEKR